MNTAEQNPVGHLLDGMVNCRACDAPMVTARSTLWETPRYVCSRRQDGCDTPVVLAEPLARLVVERVIRAALEVDNTRRVAESVREDASRRSGEYTTAELKEILRTMAPHPSEYIPEPDPEMRRLLDLDPAEYIVPLRRLNRYWDATGDTGHIEGYAHDPSTYLRLRNIRSTKAILETALEEILVGSGSATIRYRTPMPPGSGTKGKLQEELDLPI